MSNSDPIVVDPNETTATAGGSQTNGERGKPTESVADGERGKPTEE